MNKRDFIKSGLLAVGGVSVSLSQTSCQTKIKKDSIAESGSILPAYSIGKVSKREKVLAVLDQSKPNQYVPSAFFMHFKDKLGQGAIKTHIEYFRATNMDFSKIQYEVVIPKQPEIKTPKDWEKIPVYGKDFFEPQLEVIREITKELKSEALIIPTVYSPLLLATEVVGRDRYLAHAQEDPDAVEKGIRNLTESILYYIRESIKIGVDGFYLSTHGGDKAVFYDGPLFSQLIKPYDDIIFKEANDNSLFNILHICSPENTYQKLDHLSAYPSSVINPPTLLNDGTTLDLKETQHLFRRPVMGGLDNHGVIAHGKPEDILKEVDKVLEKASPNFILAANCTISGDVPWQTLRRVIDYAHDWRINRG
jgi:uroporphyrinogen decarboxylase